MSKILVATGSSLNKMNGVADTIKKMCSERNVDVEVVAQNIYEVKLEEINPNVIVILGNNILETDLPIIDGVPFITTIGTEQAIEAIIKEL